MVDQQTTDVTLLAAPKKRRRAHGEGSLYQRASDGKWVGAIDLGYVDGKPRRRVFYGKTQKEAREKMNAAKREQEQGRDLSAKRETVETFMRRWLADVVVPRLAPKTVEQYSILTTKHIIPSLGWIGLDKLTPADVTRFLREKQASGLSASTVNHLRKILRTALNVAVKWAIIVRNPVVATDKVQGDRIRPDRPMTVAEMEQFLLSIKDDEHEPMYRLTLMLGLRIGETLGLMWENVDLTGEKPWSVGRPCLRIEWTAQPVRQPDGTRVVALKAPKTRDSRRVLPIPASLIPLLKAHKARQNERRLMSGPAWQDQGLLFTSNVGRGIEQRHALRLFHAACKQAGIDRRRLHDLRHSAATKLMADGLSLLEVSKLLGHSQLATTSDIYGHVLSKELANAVDRLDAAWGV